MDEIQKPNRDDYETTKEYRAAYSKYWAAKNPDKIKAAYNRWLKKNPNYHRDRYHKNPEKSRAACYQWRDANREHYREYQREYHRKRNAKLKALRAFVDTISDKEKE